MGNWLQRLDNGDADADCGPALSHIAHGLWIGSRAALRSDTLLSLGVHNVLNVSRELRTSRVIDWEDLCASGIVCKHFPLRDDSQQRVFPSRELDDALRWIDSALAQGGQVLVNCYMGRSRSATVVLAYLISRCGMTLPQALGVAKARRPITRPNANFLQQLANLDAALHAVPGAHSAASPCKEAPKMLMDERRSNQQLMRDAMRQQHAQQKHSQKALHAVQGQALHAGAIRL
eukprot:TRINITY_DN33506_c0_g1_i1.p1 TRINITY_DN33506_c0_g1~~TRINITY_DN33506_c0_g1_i1.p1  ORF type:complete len:254 (-),score=32.98 TRINITY_DN33506_c0_g1_i1:53-751(-)